MRVREGSIKLPPACRPGFAAPHTALCGQDTRLRDKTCRFGVFCSQYHSSSGCCRECTRTTTAHTCTCPPAPRTGRSLCPPHQGPNLASKGQTKHKHALVGGTLLRNTRHCPCQYAMMYHMTEYKISGKPLGHVLGLGGGETVSLHMQTCRK